MLHRKRTLTWYFLKMLVSVAKKVPTFSKKGVARISHSGIISPCRRARGAEANHWMWAFSSGGERFPDTEEVTSSNLVTPTICDADMAQLVEHHLAKVRVAGSNPVVRSMNFKRSVFRSLF